MSRRREQLERAAEREEKRLENQFAKGQITQEQYNEEQRDLEDEMRDSFREAQDQDMEDLRDDWRF